MTTYPSYVTNVGINKIEAAYNAGETINLTEMAIGDSNGAYVEPDSAFTELVNEFARVALNDASTDGHLIHVISYITPTAETAEQTLREYGIYDDEGDMIIYGAYPESLIPSLDSAEYLQLEVENITELENADVVNVTVSPIVPNATETEAGIAKIIDDDDVEAGVDDSKILTISKMLKRVATSVKAGVARFATSAEAINGTDTSVMLNPSSGLALLKSRISSALDGTRTDYSASEDALRQVNKKADYAYNPSNLPPYTLMQTVDLTAQDSSLFYPLVLNGTSNSVGRGWVVELASQGGAATVPYNATTLVGYLRGGGYSDYDQLFDVNVSIYDEDELTIHSAWQGTEGFPGVVIYLRGGSKYYLRTNDIAEVHTDTNFSDGNSVFPAGLASINTDTLTKASLLAEFTHTGNYNNIGVFNTENPPTPEQVGAVPITRTINSKALDKNIILDSDDIGSLKGKTVKANFGNQDSWIKIATAYLPSSSSTIKIGISGGGGFNAGADYQSSMHQIIARAGNAQGQVNCRLHTQDMRGCPFSQVGAVHIGDSQFDIYGKSRSDYSHAVIVEYSSTNTFTTKNEAATETPSGLYEGDVVEEFNSIVPPTLDTVGAAHIGKAATCRTIGYAEAGIGGTPSPLIFGELQDPFDITTLESSGTNITVNFSGYYMLNSTLRWDVHDGDKSIDVSIYVNGTIVETLTFRTEGLIGAMALPFQYYAHFSAGDSIKVGVLVNLESGSTAEGYISSNGSLSLTYTRPSDSAATRVGKEVKQLAQIASKACEKK